MRKNKIWAAAVNNLSVARYFAAMEVDIVSFAVMEPNDKNKIHAMREWIEGPSIGLELDDIVYTKETYDLIREVDPDLVLASPFLNVEGIPTKLYRKTIFPDFDDLPCQVIIFENPIDDLSVFESLSAEDIYLDGPLSQANITFIKSHLPHIGIVVRGGDEEKPGIKSFDELDEFFEAVNN